MRKKTKVIYGEAVKQALKNGIDSVAKAVSVTMGPGGKLVILPGIYGQRVVTRDGVTVAKSIQLEDDFENEAAQLVKQVAAKTNDSAGDGTSTSIVLAQALVEEGMKYVASGGNPVGLRNGMTLAAELASEYIDQVKQPITYSDLALLEHVATISANDQELGKMIAEAFTSVGENGVVTFEESKQSKTTLEIVEGLTFESGMLSPFFNMDPSKNKIEFEDCRILIWEGRITNPRDLVPILEMAVARQFPLLIVCDDLDADALAVALYNNAQGKVRVCAIKSPGYGDRKRGYLEDLAVATGAKFFIEEMKHSLTKVTLEELGFAKKVEITKEDTTFIDPQGDKTNLEQHVQKLKGLYEDADQYDKEKLMERVAKLSSGVAVLKLGAETSAELGELKFRTEDAISAVKAALADGIVPGAGNTLLGVDIYLRSKIKKSSYNQDLLAGFNIFCRALSAPAFTIAENAGFSGAAIVQKAKESISKKKGNLNYGFNSRSGNWVDLFKDGVIDPAKVTKAAIQNAVSIAGLVLTTETLIVNIEEDN